MNYGDIKKQLRKELGMKKTIEVEVDFVLGEFVYLKVAGNDIRGMVTIVMLCPHGMLYQVTWDTLAVSNHYAIELSSTPCYNHEENDDERPNIQSNR